MHIKIDENLGLVVKQILRDAGYSAIRVTDQNLSGRSDEEIWGHVTRENRFFITLDTDFADVRS